MSRFAVSATLTKQLIDRLNIQTYINIYDAVSESEAVGMFIFDVSKRLPEHNIWVRPVSVIIEERGKAERIFHIREKRKRWQLLR